MIRDIKKLKQIAPRSAPNEPLSVLEKEAILVGMYWGLTVNRIASTWEVSKGSVKRFKNGLFEAPLSVFRLPVISRVGNGLFQCRLCGDAKNKLSQAQRHLLSHFFAHEIAQNIDLNDMPEAL